MDHAKLTFLQSQFPELLKNLQTDAQPKWGKMNARQMVEHVADFFRVSSNKLQFPLVTPEERLPQYMAFLYSDKEFRENTQAPLEVIPEEPLAERYADLPEAIAALKNEVDDFVLFFRGREDRKTMHPVFGNLDFNEWILLHYKHVIHHLKQFDLR